MTKPIQSLELELITTEELIKIMGAILEELAQREA